MLQNQTNSEKISYLKWYDILVLTIILIGDGIYNSTMSFVALQQETTTISDNLIFTSADNYTSLIKQAGLLIIALIYLWFRRFDFKTWHFRFDLKTLFHGVLLFAGVALLFDAYTLATSQVESILPTPNPIGAFFNSEPVSRVLYSLLNGTYEELYFLGMCLAVKPKYLKFAVPFSLLVRFSFHTYQGLTSAIGIGFLFGLYFYLFFRNSKDKNLIPFFIAHAIADIFGISLIFQFWK